jgi:cysteinyl-tRNA synthetase
MSSKIKFVPVLCLLLFGVLSGCSADAGKVDQHQTARLPKSFNDDGTSGKKVWLYQLQNADPAEIAAGGYEIAVIDPTSDGETRFTKKQIKEIQAGGTTVLAYFSIGEASSYLPYWKPAWGKEEDGELQIAAEAPQWLGRKPNPDWPESVKVRYWQEEWWDVLKRELDLIKSVGFDGVYLDIVDAYFYWGDRSTYLHEPRLLSDPQNEEEAAEWMMELVERISGYTKEESSDFQVFPQNAENIFDYDDGSYLKAIDGMGTEDLWYDEMEKSSDTAERLPYLEMIQKAGKKVLSVDYVQMESPGPEDYNRFKDYLQQCSEKEFFCLPAMADRELDRLIPKEEILLKEEKQ